MAHSKQAWENLAETASVLSDSLLQLTNQGIIERDILGWLAHYRRDLAKGDDFQSDEAEADILTATILERMIEDLEAVGREAVHAGIIPTLGTPPEGISDEDCQRELDHNLPLLLDDGIDEMDILRWLALWRKGASMDETRGKFRPMDLQLARVSHAAADKLEAALEEWAESDPFVAEDNSSAEQTETTQPIIMTPGARILSKNPGLMEGCTDFAGMMKRLNHTGRNEPCPCKSGKKFKKCCGGN